MPNLAALAALIGDPSRALMLQALLPGEALTAGELARVAGIGAPAASAHLRALEEGGLLLAHAQGRHRWFRLAGEEVAQALEALLGLAERQARRPWPHDTALRRARLCWHHLAGQLGVALHQRLTTDGTLRAAPGGWAPTPAGEARLRALGVEVDAAARAPRPCADCMDWSERRPHLAGGLGRELAALFLRRRWLVPLEAPPGDVLRRRRLQPTPEGARALHAAFGLAP
ncbi:ArsR/SmtB family transcription factor [Roseococcus sp. DSY-14]|uniref:ArsR/SmtB family transcription factor n=1 Tax=Roseococcus sp. DSY-14 TaxID=3369650 RepID=UPI00387AD86D